MNSMKLSYIEQKDLILDVNTYLETCDNQLIYYSDEWINFIQKIYSNIKVKNIVYTHQGSIVALMRFAYIEDPDVGTVINSLPFYGSHGGPIILSNDPVLECDILKAFSVISNELNSISSTIIESPYQQLNQSFLENLSFKCVDSRIGQITFLPQGNSKSEIEEKLFNILHVKTRNAVRKGKKLPIKIEISLNETDWIWMHHIHNESIKALGGKPKPYDVFKHLRDALEDHVELYIAKLEGSEIPIAALVILRYRDTIEYFTPVVDTHYKDRQALSALIFHVMVESAYQDFKYWNWGGTWHSQVGVYRFKSRWGAKDFPYRYFNKIVDPSIKNIDLEKLQNKFPYFYTFKY